MSPKRIVLCLDGTWNSPFDEQKREDGTTVLRPSNVLKVARAVLPVAGDGREQIVYYDLGVGSLAKYPGRANALLVRADKILGGVFGAGFEGNVEDALGFLTMNYLPGDEIFIFGFSRGAATARAVTQFLEWSGGLPVKADAYYLPHLFRAYVTSAGQPAAFKAKVAEINRDRGKLGALVPVRVDYLGVWDTVAALGSLEHLLHGDTNNPKRSFHVGPSLVGCVRNARHAIAADERRADFPPEIWQSASDAGQTMEQRWFPGVHSNVGGSYRRDGLANIALRWIIDGAKPLAFDEEFLRPFKQVVDGTQYESRTRKYRILEAIPGRRRKGVRQLVGQPAAANLDLHPSVIDRMRVAEVWFDPTGKKEFKGRYRPENVIRYLATIADLPAYLARIGSPGALPEDVMKQIDEFRKESPPVALAGLTTP